MENNRISYKKTGSRTPDPRRFPPGNFPPWINPSLTFPSRLLPLTDNSLHVTSPPTLFQFVARFARTRIGDSSRNRFVSTVYFAQSQTTLFPCILFMGGMLWGGNNRVGTFRGEYSSHPHIIEYSRYEQLVIIFLHKFGLKNNYLILVKRTHY